MQISTFIQNLTGLDMPTLFNPVSGLVAIQSISDGKYTITKWNVPNVTKPTDAELATALAAAEPVDTAKLTSYADAKQAEASGLGTTVNVDPSASTARPVFASTDTASLTLLSGTLQYVQLNSSAVIPWVNKGVTISLSAAEVAALALGVYAFIQSTFATHSDITAKIAAGTITTTAQIDAIYPTLPSTIAAAAGAAIMANTNATPSA